MYTVKCIFVILTWSIFSFVCHYCARVFVTKFASTVSLSNIVGPSILTIGQVSACTTLLHTNLRDYTPRTYNLLWIALTCHFCATLTTNYSFIKMHASSCLIIKLGEPIFSAIILSLTMKGHSLTFLTVVSLLLVVHGSINFTDSSISMDLTDSGMNLAFLSNILLAIRNIVIKEGLPSCRLKSKPNQRKSILLNIVVLFSIVLYNIITCSTCDSITLTLYHLTSCVSHVIYTYVSLTLVLENLGVVGHSVANIFKRLSVIALMVMVEKRSLSLTMCVGLLEATIGFIIYIIQRIITLPKQNSMLGKKIYFWRLAVILFMSVASIGIVTMSDHSQSNDIPISMDEQTHTFQHGFNDTSKIFNGLKEIFVDGNNITFIGFMTKNQPREYSLTYLGLQQILKYHKVNYNRCDNLDNCSKTMESDLHSVIVLQCESHTLASTKLKGRTVVYFPEILYDDTFHKELQMKKYKDYTLYIITHTNVAERYYSQVHDNVMLVPHFGFYIETTNRFMSPTNDVVALQHQSSGNICDKFDGIRCDSRDWESNWYTPNYNGEKVDHINQAWFGFMHILRGRVVYTEKLGGLIVAVLYGVPCFVANDAVQYVDTWKNYPHLQVSPVFITSNTTSAAVHIYEYLNENLDLPPLWKVFEKLKYPLKT